SPPPPLCPGCSTGMNAPLLTAISHLSGGELITQQHLLQLTQHLHPQQQQAGATASAAFQPDGSSSSSSGFGNTSLLCRQLSGCLSRVWGSGGRLDCYCSEGLRLLQWLGPLEALSDQDDVPHIPASAPPAATTATTATPVAPTQSGPSAAAAAAAAPYGHPHPAATTTTPPPAPPPPPPPPTASAPSTDPRTTPLGAAAAAAAAGGAPTPTPPPPTPNPTTPASPSSSPWRLSPTACAVAGVEAGRGASLRLEVTRDLEGVPSLFLQVAFHFLDLRSRRQVVRVVTRRLGVVESRGEFLRGVNPTAAAALLGRRAALEAKKAGAFRDARRAEEARLSLAAQLGLVAARCGREVQTSRGVLGFGARKAHQWPPELMPLAYALYHLARGPILAPPRSPAAAAATGLLSPAAAALLSAGAHPHQHALWDCDLRLTASNALLRSAWGDAYRAMAPKLFAVLPQQQQQQPLDGASTAAAAGVGNVVQLAALPCVSLAAVMARTVPLLLDVGTAVLVSPTEEPSPGGDGRGSSGGGGGGGGELTAALIDAALQAASAGSLCGRFPVPAVVLTPHAQTGRGALAARLIPVHRDGYEEQALQQPQLQQLGPQVAEQLSKQLREGAAVEVGGLPPAVAKQAAAVAGASFVEWCRCVNVQPFPVKV
ncbi:hypothetical protein Agub_g5882, partial [Astrephomene gubernaculifera]